MEQTKHDCSKNSNTVRFGTNLQLAPDGGDMGKEERKRQVLGLLVESGLDLPPAVIFHNLKQRGATFERRSVDNYLGELREQGYVEKSDDSKGYYSATKKGRNFYLG